MVYRRITDQSWRKDVCAQKHRESRTTRIDDSSGFLTDQRTMQLSRCGSGRSHDRADRRVRLTMHSSAVRSNCCCWPSRTRHYGHDTPRICNLRLNRWIPLLVFFDLHTMTPARYDKHCRNYYRRACIGFVLFFKYFISGRFLSPSSPCFQQEFNLSPRYSRERAWIRVTATNREDPWFAGRGGSTPLGGDPRREPENRDENLFRDTRLSGFPKIPGFPGMWRFPRIFRDVQESRYPRGLWKIE